MRRRLPVGVVAVALLAGACSDKPWVRAVESSRTVPGSSTTDPANPTADGALTARAIVEALAADELGGRDNQSPGSVAAQQLIVEQLAQFAQPVVGTEFLQPFEYGTNIVGIIPGGDLADQYVVIGAHYDHIGSSCDSSDPVDHICNGATDNASGVATVISIARAIAAAGTPRRSVVVALWDAEEGGLLGSAAYVANPPIPLAQTVVYLNFDIQGAALLPSIANATFAAGAETGGSVLMQASANAMASSTLEPVVLGSFLFQGRSDHASFAEAGVPAMIFSDGTGGCYHTAQDEVDIVDFAKLDRQVAAGVTLVRDLASTDSAPQFDPAAANVTFADAVALLALTERSLPDMGLLAPGAAAQVEQFARDLRAIVDAGAGAFDATATVIVRNGVDQFVESLTESKCQNFAAK